MATRASRDKRIAAADKKIEAALVRKAKGQELISEADAVIRKAEADKEWLAGMPVDDDDQPSPGPLVEAPVEADAVDQSAAESDVADEAEAATAVHA